MVEAVFQATVTELARAGYERLRIEDVADRAGVNKTTIYRRWPTKAELVTAALGQHRGFSNRVPDTGSVRGDLLDLLRRTAERLQAPDWRGVLRTTMTDASHPEVAAIVRALRKEHFEPWRVVISNAIAKRELPAGSDPELICQTIVGVVVNRVLHFGEKADDRFLEGVVDLVLVGARSGGAVRRGRRTRA